MWIYFTTNANDMYALQNRAFIAALLLLQKRPKALSLDLSDCCNRFESIAKSVSVQIILAIFANKYKKNGSRQYS